MTLEYHQHVIRREKEIRSFAAWYANDIGRFSKISLGSHAVIWKIFPSDVCTRPWTIHYEQRARSWNTGDLRRKDEQNPAVFEAYLNLPVCGNMINIWIPWWLILGQVALEQTVQTKKKAENEHDVVLSSSRFKPQWTRPSMLQELVDIIIIRLFEGKRSQQLSNEGPQRISKNPRNY